MKHTNQSGPVGRRTPPPERRASTSHVPRAYRPSEPAREAEWQGEPHLRRSEQFRRPAQPLHSSPPPPRQGRKLLPVLSVVVALVVLAALGVALLKSRLFSQAGTSHAPVATSTTAPTPQPTDAPPQAAAYSAAFGDSLRSLSMTSASEGWAVGDTRGSPLLLHNAGDHWDRITNAIGGGLQTSYFTLTQVMMLSAGEGWAVGSYQDFSNNGFGLILHYTGGRWMPQETLPKVSLNGLAMLSASEGWAVGATSSQQAVLLHYTGGAWDVVPLAAMLLNHIVMTSPTDGWIIGRFDPNTDAAWHYNGTAWTQVTIPGVTFISQIAMVSASDGWVVGYKVGSGGARNALAVDSSGAPGPTVFAHYDGKTWATAQTFTQDMQVTSLSLGTAKDGWAVGTFANPDGAIATTHTLYLHYTGGRWKQVAGPDDPNANALSVTMLSASDGWAVSDDGAILRYQQNAWKTVAGPGSK